MGYLCRNHISLSRHWNGIGGKGLGRLPPGIRAQRAGSDVVSEDSFPQLTLVETPIGNRTRRRHDWSVKSSETIQHTTLLGGKTARPYSSLIDTKVRILTAHLNRCPLGCRRSSNPWNDLGLHPVIQPNRCFPIHSLDEDMMPEQILWKPKSSWSALSYHCLDPVIDYPHFANTVKREKSSIGQFLDSSRSTRLGRSLQGCIGPFQPESDSDILDLGKRLHW